MARDMAADNGNGASTIPQNTEIDPEYILKELGGCGRYQIRMSVVVHLIRMIVCSSSYHIVIFSSTPSWHCLKEEVQGDNFTFDVERGSCEVEKETCNIGNGTKCAEYSFDSDFNTFVSEFSLVCEHNFIPNTISTINIVGILVGNLIGGQAADTFGRKRVLFGSLLVLLVFHVVAYFSTTWQMLAAAYFFTGFGCGFSHTVLYTILSEYTLSKWRVFTVGFPSLPLQTCMLALVSWLIHDWKNIQLLIVFMILPAFTAWSASLDIALHGLAFGLQVLSGNIYLNVFLFNIAGVPSKVIAIWLQNRFGRRATIFLGFSIVGSAGLTAGCVQITNVEHKDVVINVCAFIANAGITMTWGPLQTLSIEIYPTVIRNIGLGYLNVIAKISAVIGPQLVYLNTFVPGIIFFVPGGVAVVSIFATIFLPETMDRKLPDKIEPLSLKEVINVKIETSTL